jgi:hypothetical protein
LISPYEPKNIYNADKTGLFFGHYQQNHLWLREKRVLVAKCPKKYIVLLCGNKVGEMEKPPVMEKAAKPTCFKNLKLIIYQRFGETTKKLR